MQFLQISRDWIRGRRYRHSSAPPYLLDAAISHILRRARCRPPVRTCCRSTVGLLGPFRHFDQMKGWSLAQRVCPDHLLCLLCSRLAEYCLCSLLGYSLCPTCFEASQIDEK